MTYQEYRKTITEEQFDKIRAFLTFRFPGLAQAGIVPMWTERLIESEYEGLYGKEVAANPDVHPLAQGIEDELAGIFSLLKKVDKRSEKADERMEDILNVLKRVHGSFMYMAKPLV